MKRRRHTPEQIVRKLREADRMLGDGIEVLRCPTGAAQFLHSTKRSGDARPCQKRAGDAVLYD